MWFIKKTFKFYRWKKVKVILIIWLQRNCFSAFLMLISILFLQHFIHYFNTFILRHFFIAVVSLCLAGQQEEIQKLAPLRSQLRLVKEECERKIRAQWREQHNEIEMLKREKQQLQEDVQSMKETEKNMQTVVRCSQLCLCGEMSQFVLKQLRKVCWRWCVVPAVL